ncbi:protein of unknown function [Cardinium endosymbiont cEper1 of Encarsia pergandiella]|nr:protein of unknown function [Cardinium endosymbiont cEper1 of Encarsia pergandiella]
MDLRNKNDLIYLTLLESVQVYIFFCNIANILFLCMQTKVIINLVL